jgi:hypothetical protein
MGMINQEQRDYIMRYNPQQEKLLTAHLIEEGKKRLRYAYRRSIQDGHFERFHKAAEVVLTLGVFARQMEGHEHELDDPSTLDFPECRICGLTPAEIASLPDE